MATKKSKKTEDNGNQQTREEKIQSLQEMIAAAEQTITSAKQMLSQIRGENSPAAAPQTYAAPAMTPEGQVIHGAFDGQIMIGQDGKQYPVPANYASKSKLVEGDMLKLTITMDGNFIYKQIGPAERKYLIGTVSQDERGNYIVNAEEKKYKVLLAAATYFKIEPEDEVTLVVPRFQHSVWGAIENVIRKADDISNSGYGQNYNSSYDSDEYGDNSSKPAAIERLEKEIEAERKKEANGDSIIDEWTPDINALKKEAGYPARMKSDMEEDF